MKTPLDPPTKKVSQAPRNLYTNSIFYPNANTNYVFLGLTTISPRQALEDHKGLCCWWDKHPLTNVCVQCPVKFDNFKNLFSMEGLFCSWNCALAYGLTQKSIAMYVNQWIFAIQLFVKKQQRTKSGSVPDVPASIKDKKFDIVVCAPHWSVLKPFGGMVSISEYRNSHCKDVMGYDVIATSSCFVPAGFMVFEHASLAGRQKVFEQNNKKLEICNKAVIPIKTFRDFQDRNAKQNNTPALRHCVFRRGRRYTMFTPPKKKEETANAEVVSQVPEEKSSKDEKENPGLFKRYPDTAQFSSLRKRRKMAAQIKQNTRNFPSLNIEPVDEGLLKFL